MALVIAREMEGSEAAAARALSMPPRAGIDWGIKSRMSRR
jgi:hypothetical protein